MKFYKNENVLTEAQNRISYLFDEFPEIIVGISGGKDSVVIFNLTMAEAKKRGRLPLNVMWIDQEVEWQASVDICEEIMTNPDVKPYWFQMPMVITNNANTKERYNYCWKEEEKNKWVREKHPISIKENIYGTIRFHDLFGAIIKKEFENKKAAYIAGVRAEEAPKRAMILTGKAKYKHVTWGKIFDDLHYTFYPIYDWSYTDVWKYIYDNKIKYNKVYDELYKHGTGLNDMRISNLHHETSIQSLLLVQEIEPDTWNKVVNRIVGANTIKHLKKESFQCPKELPYMFESWEEYAKFLIEKLVPEGKNRNKIFEIINKDLKIYTNNIIKRKYFKIIINTILSADWDFTKIINFRIRPSVYLYRRFKRKKYDGLELKERYLTLFTEAEKKQLKKELLEWKLLKNKY